MPGSEARSGKHAPPGGPARRHGLDPARGPRAEGSRLSEGVWKRVADGASVQARHCIVVRQDCRWAAEHPARASCLFRSCSFASDPFRSRLASPSAPFPQRFGTDVLDESRAQPSDSARPCMRDDARRVSSHARRGVPVDLRRDNADALRLGSSHTLGQDTSRTSPNCRGDLVELLGGPRRTAAGGPRRSAAGGTPSNFLGPCLLRASSLPKGSLLLTTYRPAGS